MTQRVVLVRHGHDPNDDRVATYLSQAGFEIDVRKPFAGDTIGEVTDDVAGTVVYGGMYNAYDTEKHPFLNEEYRWIGAALDAGIPVLGLCQGAQMMAYHQGAWAGAPDHGKHEFGLYEVSPTDADDSFMPSPMHVTQAHYHTFDLPNGAVHLARSEMFENQAFRMGDKAYGFQFHPEQTVESFRRWQTSRPNSYEKPGAQDQAEQDRLLYEHDAAQAAWFFSFLEGFLGRAE